MNPSDNVKALRAFAEALTANDAEDMNEPGKRSLCQFLRDSADEIETLRTENAHLRSAFRVNMLIAYPGKSHAEIDNALKEITT